MVGDYPELEAALKRVGADQSVGLYISIIDLQAERADIEPKVFTKIHLRFVITGKNLKETQVKRAVELSAEKYCSASILMARAGVEVTHDYEIIEID